MPFKELHAPFRFDRSWPAWAAGRYSTKKSFDRTAAEIIGSNTQPHELLFAAEDVVELRSSDNPAAFIMHAKGEAVGELWLRTAVLHKSKIWRKRSFLTTYCETYVYRRGWRDPLTAEMDEQEPGEVVYPKRANDVYCDLDRSARSIYIEAPPYILSLSKGFR